MYSFGSANSSCLNVTVLRRVHRWSCVRDSENRLKKGAFKRTVTELRLRPLEDVGWEQNPIIYTKNRPHIV
jgi:hypothetical protein